MCDLGRRVEVTGGFLLALAALFYLDRDGLLPPALLACCCHELGHVAVIYLTGGRVAGLRISAAGAELRLSARGRQSPLGMALSALAGPGVNLLLALLFARRGGARGQLFAGLNLALGCFNLLPVGQLDGGRALRCLLAGRTGERAAEAISLAVSVLLAGLGGWTFWATGRNFTLLLTAFWLIFSFYREKA